jgi:hypothetical protein
MVEAEWAVGWNKIIRDGAIYSWHSDQITVYPLRLAVMEIESNDDIYISCRSLLTDLWQDDLKYSIDSASPDIIHNLQELGVNPLLGLLDKYGLALLHRLNIDMRDRPLIERLHWAGGISTVVLSDGGKYQVSRDAIWASAIEAGLKSDGRFDSVLKDFLRKIFPETLELNLPVEMDNESQSGMDRFLSRLIFYRAVKLEIDKVVFIIKPGSFPELALKLWE